MALAAAAAGGGGHGNGKPVYQLCEEAVAITRKGITLSPHGESFYVTAAAAYETLLDPSSACAHLRYVIHVVGAGQEARHKLAGLLRDRARAWLLAGDMAAAADCLQEATRLKPVDWKMWLLLAVAYVRTGTSEGLADAIPALDHALSLKPTSHEAYILRGKCNWGLGQVDAGNRDFEQASLVAPNHPEVILFDQMMFRKASRLYQAAVAHMEAERFPQAADELTRALRVTPDDAKLLVLRATALRLTRRFKEALADLDTASKTYVSIFLDL